MRSLAPTQKCPHDMALTSAAIADSVYHFFESCLKSIFPFFSWQDFLSFLIRTGCFLNRIESVPYSPSVQLRKMRVSRVHLVRSKKLPREGWPGPSRNVETR